MVVFSLTRLGATPEIYALATVIVAMVAALLLVAMRLQAIGQQRNVQRRPTRD